MSEPSDDLPAPAPDPPPAPAAKAAGWQQQVLGTWYGSLFLGFAALVGFLIVGQVIPGAGVAIYIAATGGSLAPADVEASMAPYIPIIVLSGVPAALGLLGLLKLVRLLPPPPKPPARAWIGVAWVLGLSAVCFAGQLVISWLQTQAGAEFQEQTVLLAAAKQSSLWFALAICVGAPLAEEVVFRRILFSVLSSGCGRVVAYGLSAIAFSLIHGNLPGFFLYIWIACCCALAYERTGSLWGAFAIHCVNNSVALANM